MNDPTILDGLNNSRCGSFRCDSVFLDAAKICLDKQQFGLCKTNSRITVNTFSEILDQINTFKSNLAQLCLVLFFDF